MEPALREYRELKKISDAFGYDLAALPLKPDFSFIRSVRELAEQEPLLKNKRVLFLNRPQFIYHEKNILLFFNRRFGRCDCCHVTSHQTGLNARLDNVRTIQKKDIFRSSYDTVVVYKGLPFLCKHISKIRADRFYILFTVSDVLDIEREPGLAGKLKNSGKKITYLNLFKNTLRYIFDPVPGVKMNAAINWPPTLDMFCRVPKRLLFDYLFMGGGARDYRFLYENRELFKGKKVIVTHCDAKKSYPKKSDCDYDTRYIRLLRKTDNFLCLDHIHENFYCKLLLYTRVTLCLFRRDISTDSTCISDAVWYGKPVITSNVHATAHLKDIVFYINSPDDLKRILKKLDHPAYYRKTVKKVLKSARKDHNLFNLLKLVR